MDSEQGTWKRGSSTLAAAEAERCTVGATLREWLLHLPCEETKRYVGNFLAVYRVRPEHEAETATTKMIITNDLVVGAGDLEKACDTPVPATDGDTKTNKWSSHRKNSSWMPLHVRRHTGERCPMNPVCCRTYAKAWTAPASCEACAVKQTPSNGTDIVT